MHTCFFVVGEEMKSKVTLFDYVKKDFIDTVTNEYSLYLFLISIICYFLLGESSNKLWNPVISLLWVIHFVLFIYYVNMDKSKSFVENKFMYFLTFCMVIFWVTYLFSIINPVLVVFPLYVFFAFLFSYACFKVYRYGIGFYGETNKFLLVIKYLIFSALVIIIFAIMYYVIHIVTPNNTIASDVQNVSMDTSGDYLYFSFQTYFLNSYGEYYPIGKVMRLTTSVETVFTFIITVIVIAGALQNPHNREVKKKK